HYAPAMLAFELEPFGHQLDDDRGAAHRERAAERDRTLPAQAARTPGQREAPAEHGVAGKRREHRQADLAQPEPEDELAHALELGQVELEADDEHQEHDT